MKKFILAILFCSTAFYQTFSAVKVNFFLSNFRITSNYWTVDLNATVFALQSWRVGSCNIRIDWNSVPPNAVSIRPEVYNPASCINNNGSYGSMNVTIINGGATASLNIAYNQIGPCCRLLPGTYTLASIRFNRLDTSACVRLSINTNSVIRDSLTQLYYPTDWITTIDTFCRRIDYMTGIEKENELPLKFKLFNNYPNPFNPVTKINFDIPLLRGVSEGRGLLVKLIIYDIIGREVTTLVNENLKPGTYEVEFDGTNYPSGIYFYSLITETYTNTKRMVILR